MPAGSGALVLPAAFIVPPSQRRIRSSAPTPPHPHARSDGSCSSGPPSRRTAPSCSAPFWLNLELRRAGERGRFRRRRLKLELPRRRTSEKEEESGRCLGTERSTQRGQHHHQPNSNLPRRLDQKLWFRTVTAKPPREQKLTGHRRRSRVRGDRRQASPAREAAAPRRGGGSAGVGPG